MNDEIPNEERILDLVRQISLQIRRSVIDHSMQPTH